MQQNAKYATEFGALSFNTQAMRDKLPQDVFYSLLDTIRNHSPLDPKLANTVAHGMKEWALENGATHYTHWFQPLTGLTAEKHDSFLTADRDGTFFSRFSGNQLITSEPDASSLPSGGIRSTFEARGYTAWDPGSPAFILKRNGSATLCIPSVYFSYNGETLDEKTPLLRSCENLSNAATKLLHLIGRKDVRAVYPMVGAEQEFFLIEKDAYRRRPDLVFCGRTLFGIEPPKGQQLDDHYFGAIPAKVMHFFRLLELRAFELGIPIKTRHNEVAPKQFEVACLHEHANIACDHNLLLMELMRLCASEAGLELLLHEKPFYGVNGSGKHNNWSLQDSIGNNLLDPGTKPKENLQFMLFLLAVVQAVHDHGDIMMASVAGAGNDLRLGACEAPPATISVFLGRELSDVLNRIEQDDRSVDGIRKVLDLGLCQLPKILADNTDRNRTSPFAFTGNKFEFRAVPSSIPLGFPNTVINLAVTDALEKISAHLSLSKEPSSETSILNTIKHFCLLSKPVRFEGDSYVLTDCKSDMAGSAESKSKCPALLSALTNDNCKRLFTEQKVLNATELHARYSIKLDIYAKKLEIELNTIQYMMQNILMPEAMKYLQKIGNLGSQDTQINSHVSSLRAVIANMNTLISETKAVQCEFRQGSNYVDRAIYMCGIQSSLIARCRENCEEIESCMSVQDFPIPKYHELLFDWVSNEYRG